MLYVVWSLSLIARETEDLIAINGSKKRLSEAIQEKQVLMTS